MNYWMTIDDVEDRSEKFASIKVKVENSKCINNYEYFFICVDLMNYELAGYTISFSDMNIDLNKKDYTDVDLLYADTAVKPECESKSINEGYDTFKIYKKWWEDIDHDEFKKRIKKKLIDAML